MSAIKPNMLCAVVAPFDCSVNNRMVTTLRLELAQFFDAHGVPLLQAPGHRAWWVHCPTPISTAFGSYNEVPVPEQWLRPIQGDADDLAAHDEAPRDETLQPKRQVEHSR